MEDKFDDYLKHELDSLNNAPIPSHLWDKESTWEKISSGLKPTAKTISIKWFYAAASIALILFGVSATLYKNSNTQISFIKNENQRLLKDVIAQHISGKQSEIKPKKVITIYKTKETIKNEIVQKTIYVHDTITITSYIKEPVYDQITLNNLPFASDSLASPVAQIKRNKLHFVITNENGVSKDDNNFSVVSSKGLFQKDQEPENNSIGLKIALN